jgi:hypothetical protein
MKRAGPIGSVGGSGRKYISPRTKSSGGPRFVNVIFVCCIGSSIGLSLSAQERGIVERGLGIEPSRWTVPCPETPHVLTTSLISNRSDVAHHQMPRVLRSRARKLLIAFYQSLQMGLVST